MGEQADNFTNIETAYSGSESRPDNTALAPRIIAF